MYGNPGTDGTWMSNFWSQVKNEHPILSIFLIHPEHPFTGPERFLVLFCTLCFSLFLTVSILAHDHSLDI